MDVVTQSEKEKFWRSEIAQLEKFPGSASAFCRSRGLSLSGFRYWQKKLATSGAGSDLVASPFISVDVAEPKRIASALPDPRWLAELVVHLSEAVR